MVCKMGRIINETAWFKGGGVLVEFQGAIFLMNFELLTFLCRLMIKFPYTTCFQNESIYLQKTHLLCDACIVYNI